MVWRVGWRGTYALVLPVPELISIDVQSAMTEVSALAIETGYSGCPGWGDVWGEEEGVHVCSEGSAEDKADEDVVLSEDAEAFRSRPIPGSVEAAGEKTAGKKKRSRKKKSAATAAGGDEADNDKDGDEEEEEKGEGEGEATAPTGPADAVKESETAQPSVDTEKKTKALQKKIRQAQDLKLRKDNGEKLLPEQLDKALRLDELIRDLEKLGVKHEG
ncbi:hypothetical protein ABW21_db0203938 [Orbilia brochopaga]|nr:hypothetical protein ABW21_db0203938 [Drechslerella brochopaga]